jgi:hypothetical protein
MSEHEQQVPTSLINLLNSKSEVEQDKDGDSIPKGLGDILDRPETVSDVPIAKPEIKRAIVAYVEELGTSQHMKSIDSDEAADKIYGKINGLVEEFQNGFNKLSKICQESMAMIISDSFVIAIPYDTNAFKALVSFLADFQYNCLTFFSQILRGAISGGNIIGGIPNKSRIIGPAFIDAHVIEEQIAIFPRIIVDSTIINDKGLYSSSALPIVSDKDGFCYIDFIGTHEIDRVVAVTQSEHSIAINERNSKHIQKWNWLLTFLEQKKNGCLYCCKQNSFEAIQKS